MEAFFFDDSWTPPSYTLLLMRDHRCSLELRSGKAGGHDTFLFDSQSTQERPGGLRGMRCSMMVHEHQLRSA